MKVLIIAQYFPSDMGGGATRAYNVAKGLSLSGCDVTVLTAFPHYPTGNIPKQYRNKLLTVENCEEFKLIRTFVPPIASKGFKNRMFLFSSFIISSLFALPFLRNVDIVWAANPNIIAVVPSLFYKILNRCKIVQNVDDLWPETLYDLGFNENSLLAKFGEFIAKITYRLSSGITPISPAYVDVLSCKYGIDRKKIEVVASGVNSNKFNIRQKNERHSGFRILYIGAFSPAYDFDQIFRAAKNLSSFSEVNFLIQGGGELAWDLKSKLKKNSHKNVKLVDKIVSRDEVADIMVDADALLLPLNGSGSIELGISSKLYEYQAAGKPILCCSNGQPGRYVLESKSGIVIAPGDSKALSESILYLSKNPEIAKTLRGACGREYAIKNLSIEQIGLKMKKFLNRIRLSKEK